MSEELLLYLTEKVNSERLANLHRVVDRVGG